MSHSRFEVVTKKVIFSISSPASMAELATAIQAAQMEAATAKNRSPETLFDDDVQIRSWDNEIQVYYEIEVKT